MISNKSPAFSRRFCIRCISRLEIVFGFARPRSPEAPPDLAVDSSCFSARASLEAFNAITPPKCSQGPPQTWLVKGNPTKGSIHILVVCSPFGSTFVYLFRLIPVTDALKAIGQLLEFLDLLAERLALFIQSFQECRAMPCIVLLLNGFAKSSSGLLNHSA